MSLDEVRLLANVHDRARRLSDCGYRAKWTSEQTVEVTTPRKRVYTIDIDLETCSCPFFMGHNGTFGCKHWFGYLLLLMQIQQHRAHLMRDCLKPKHSAQWPEWEQAARMVTP